MFDNPEGFINFVAIRLYPGKLGYDSKSNIELYRGIACPGESFAKDSYCDFPAGAFFSR